MSIPSAFQRVFALLNQFAKTAPGGLVVIEKMPTQQEIAIMVNTSRETVSRAIQILLQKGVVEKDLRRLIVRLPEVLDKAVTRGTRKSGEKVTFDQERKIVKRETNGGGKSEAQAAGECAHDALTFLQFARQELAQGRLAANQSVYLGSKYDLQLTYTGTESIKQGDRVVEADKVRVSVRGPKADTSFEIYFARDEVRTPLLARLPLALGTFTVELLP